LKRVLIVYSHFSPAFKGGGPVQSLVNLVDALNSSFKFFVFCSAYDMGETSTLNGITPDTWNNHGNNVQVFYASHSVLSQLKKCIDTVSPDIIYSNGIFLPVYNAWTMWYARRKNIRIIVAPRGMLQSGALALKSFKKNIYLGVLRFLNAHKGVVWHATDEQEKLDIEHVFGPSRIVVAANIPRASRKMPALRQKHSGELKLVYLSLIAEKKNLHLLLEALNVAPGNICLDIYGPIKDHGYWELCQKMIRSSSKSIQYKGVVEPAKVPEVLGQYHFLVLPTKGENFGHAIYEAFSVGTPAIISKYTPWGSLQESRAGVTLETDGIIEFVDVLSNALSVQQADFDIMSVNAHRLATDYIQQGDFIERYKALFGQ
jgi:glycosyltransferase involved in cell wall biosynthesis